MSGRPVVFVHTNAKQRLGAVVAAYALYRNAADPDGFEVRLLEAERVPALVAADGRAYLRDGAERRWRADDLQSFTPLRFMPPELMRYEGRALVIDPDVFAVGDVGGLLSADMAGHAILARWRPGAGGRPAYFASSVMLLDCARLRRWRLADQLGEMLDLRRDYVRWVRLELEPAGSVGPLAPGWNDFDHLDAGTRLLHLTRRRTQPWKTGLRVDFQPPERPLGSAVLGWLNRQRRERLGEYALLGRYRPHPDPAQAAVFLGLLRECLEEGIVDRGRARARGGARARAPGHPRGRAGDHPAAPRADARPAGGRGEGAGRRGVRSGRLGRPAREGAWRPGRRAFPPIGPRAPAAAGGPFRAESVGFLAGMADPLGAMTGRQVEPDGSGSVSNGR